MNIGQTIILRLPDGTELVAEIKTITLSTSTLPPEINQRATEEPLGQRIRQAREREGLTQAQLAKSLRMSVATINGLENAKSGPRGPNPSSILALKKRFRLE